MLKSSARTALVLAKTSLNGITVWSIPGKLADRLSCAAQVGFDAVQLELGSWEQGFPLSGKDTQAEVLEISQTAGLRLLPLAVNAVCDHPFVNGLDTPDGVIAIQALDGGLDAAAALGLEGITVPNFGKNRILNRLHYENTVLALCHACRYAQPLGLKVYTENLLSADQLQQLFFDCGFGNLRLLFDSQNYTHYNLPYAMDVLRTHRAKAGTFLHVKAGSLTQSVPLGEGDGPFFEVLRYLKETDYDGTIVTENNYTAAPLFSEDLTWMRRDLDVIRAVIND